MTDLTKSTDSILNAMANPQQFGLDDAHVLNMMRRTSFGPSAELVLPSGRRLYGPYAPKASDPNPLSSTSDAWTGDPETDRALPVSRALAADYARTLDATKAPQRRPAMTEPEPPAEPPRPPVNYKTRPAVPRNEKTYIPPPRVTVQTPSTPSVTTGTVAMDPARRGMGGISIALLVLGGLLFLLAGAVAFSATSFFVAVFFAAWMVIGAVCLVGGATIAALR